MCFCRCCSRPASPRTRRSTPFTIDDVAESLLRKLANRVPAVLAGEAISLVDQLAQWEERKAAEKSRNSSMDGVPTGQPSLALAQKVIDRVTAAGLPADLIPAPITNIALSVDGDAENSLRTVVLEFMDTVRTVERAIAADRRGEDVPEELDIASLGVISEEEWRAFWPSAAADVDVDVDVAETEPAPDRIPEPTPTEVPEPGPVEVPEPEPADVPEPTPEDVSENGTEASEQESVEEDQPTS